MAAAVWRTQKVPILPISLTRQQGKFRLGTGHRIQPTGGFLSEKSMLRPEERASSKIKSQESED